MRPASADGPASPSRSTTSSSPTAAPRVQRPPRAQLSTESPVRRQLSTASPARASASLSLDQANFVELLRPDGTPFSPPRPSTALDSDESSSRHPKRRQSGASSESRRASGSSLESQLGAFSQAQRRGSRASIESTSTASGAARARAASVSQLSWGTWWPFRVVAPEGSEPAPPTPPTTTQVSQEDDSRTSSNFLSLFAGRGPVDEARRHKEALSEQDRRDASLLDTDIDILRKLDLTNDLPKDPESVREADDSPMKTVQVDKSLPPTPAGHPDGSQSLFSNLFSTSTSSQTQASSSTVSDGPEKASTSGSFLPSFAMPSLFSSAQRPTTEKSSSATPSISAASSQPRPDPRPALHRHYTTSRHPRDDEGPTARKDQVEDMVDDADKKAVAEEAEENAEIFSILKERYRAPRLPVVFCHGLFGFDHLGPSAIKPLQFSYWVGVQEALEAMGVEVLIGRVPASASIEERAKVLCEMIGETFPGQEVNLIGHSMGGLDARFLISRLKPTNFKVRSLTTISTPHRGSSFADYLLEDVVGQSRVPMLLSTLSTLGVPGGGKAFDDLTTTKMARFNEETPDDPDVRYFSYGAEFEPTWSNVFKIPWGVVNEREGANDGLVSVDSSKWGEYQATLHNVNHLDLIGMVGKVRYSWAEWLGKPIKFKPISFFCALAEKLADEGF
ncbi:esterase/lipase family protein [Sporobolomyces koalae]|uniref:esterase/lipase family protein n=1 Tax=Sporobolomyces koalae TaxID=500713 RepID=UPI003170C42C